MRLFPAGIGIALLALGCNQKEEAAPTQEVREAADPPQAQAPAKAKQPTSSHAEMMVSAPGLGVCQPSQQVETMVSQLLSHADANRDQQISKKEAESLMNFLLGGFFFRADEDGDGKVTREEGRVARQEFANQNPTIAVLLQQARAVKQATGKSPFVRIAEMLDVDYEQPVSATDVREAARSALDDLYGLVDKNNDGAITQLEARSASLAGAQVIGHQAFAAADRNDDGSIELAELESSVKSSMKTAFSAADQNGDGKLTEQEAAVALNSLAGQLGIPTTANE